MPCVCRDGLSVVLPGGGGGQPSRVEGDPRRDDAPYLMSRRAPLALRRQFTISLLQPNLSAISSTE